MNTQEHPRQEPDNLRAKAVVLCAVGIIAMLLLVAAVSHLITATSGANQPSPAHPSATRSSYLTSDPTEEIARYRQEKRAQLESYGWVDGQRFAHIPIERAMQKLAAEHASAGQAQ